MDIKEKGWAEEANNTTELIMSLYNNYEHFTRTKVLVSSGCNGSGFMDSTEVVDLKSGKIFSMAPLGRSTWGATGGLLDGLPVICGGSNDKQIHSIALPRI